MLSHWVMSDTFVTPTRLHSLWNFPGINAGVGCHFLLQGIFLTQGWNPSLLRLLRWQADYLPLNHLGSTVKFSKNCSQADITVYPSVFLVDSEVLEKTCLFFSVSLGLRQIILNRRVHTWASKQMDQESMNHSQHGVAQPLPISRVQSRWQDALLPPLLVPWAVLLGFPWKHPPPPPPPPYARRPRLLLA